MSSYRISHEIICYSEVIDEKEKERSERELRLIGFKILSHDDEGFTAIRCNEVVKVQKRG